MSLVTDPKAVDTTIGEDGQQKSYLVLSDAERAKGFVRPVRCSYKHVGIAGPKHALRDLNAEEISRGYGEPDVGYVKYEAYPEGSQRSSAVGRYWTQDQLDKVGKGCGTITTMGLALAETYARSPSFYGGTFCAGCRAHMLVGAAGEFVWEPDGSRVGT
jgi:hypothetical protein